MLSLNETQILDHLIQSCSLPQETEIVRFVPESFYNQNSVLFCHSNGGRFVVKIFSPRNLPRHENEISALKQFSKISFPIPELITQGIIRSGDDVLFGYIIMSELDGCPLDEVIKGYDLLAVEKISSQLLQFLKSQREFCGDKNTELICDPDILVKKFQAFLTEPTVSHLENLGIKKEKIMVLTRAAGQLAPPRTFSYVTHDWRLRHIFVVRDGITGIIDLEYLKPNDFAAEIAHFLHDLILHNSSEARLIGCNILDNLTYIAPDDPNMIERIPLWMSKQAITHVCAKYTGGFDRAVLKKEVDLALQYGELSARNLRELFNI